MRQWTKTLAVLLAGVVAGSAMVVIALKLRHRAPFASRQTYTLRDDILVHGNQDLKEIALTIDDGPNPGTTRPLLDLLGTLDIRATFFVVGKQVQKHPGLVRRMMNEGHEVGNHSFNHPHLVELSPERIRQEIVSCDKAIYEATGAHANLFRPPGMRYDDTVIQKAQNLNYVTIHWNVAAQDYMDLDPKVIEKRVLDTVQPGSVILLHGHPDTVAALPNILKTLKAQGYRFVTVSQMLARLPRPVYVKTNAYGVDEGALATRVTPAKQALPKKAKRQNRVARSSREPAISAPAPPRGLDAPAWN